MTVSNNDKDLLTRSKAGDSSALVELWEKYRNFTMKQYHKHRELFESSNESFEDYMQDAYVAFRTAVENFSLEKIDSNGGAFSTYYYFFLLKLKNTQEDQLSRYGNMLYESDFQREEEDLKTDCYPNSWNKALSGDFSKEYGNHIAVEVFEEYFRTEEDNLKKSIVTFLLQGKNPGNIVRILNNEYSYSKVRSIIDSCFETIKLIAEKKAWC